MTEEGWTSTGLEVLTSRDFEGTRLKRPGVYAVCFGATWCPPTRRFVPKFVARKGRVAAQMAIADITDMEEPLWDVFQIKITPSIVVFREGTPVGRFDGRPILALSERDLDRMQALVGGLPSAPVT